MDPEGWLVAARTKAECGWAVASWLRVSAHGAGQQRVPAEGLLPGPRTLRRPICRASCLEGPSSLRTQANARRGGPRQAVLRLTASPPPEWAAIEQSGRGTGALAGRPPSSNLHRPLAPRAVLDHRQQSDSAETHVCLARRHTSRSTVRKLCMHVLYTHIHMSGMYMDTCLSRRPSRPKASVLRGLCRLFGLVGQVPPRQSLERERCQSHPPGRGTQASESCRLFASAFTSRPDCWSHAPVRAVVLTALAASTQLQQSQSEGWRHPASRPWPAIVFCKALLVSEPCPPSTAPPGGYCRYLDAGRIESMQGRAANSHLPGSPRSLD
ncbi:hypothetical protein CDD83_8138 [Cordyceps sp. RAO-2017]|nr:hypothetical protein CDD83_8138 [Cordyceps sp. RAO-2017]